MHLIESVCRSRNLYLSNLLTTSKVTTFSGVTHFGIRYPKNKHCYINAVLRYLHAYRALRTSEYIRKFDNNTEGCISKCRFDTIILRSIGIMSSYSSRNMITRMMVWNNKTALNIFCCVWISSTRGLFIYLLTIMLKFITGTLSRISYFVQFIKKIYYLQCIVS